MSVEVYNTNNNYIGSMRLMYIIDYGFNEGQNINLKYSPHTTIGNSQNLGRKPINFNLNIYLSKDSNDLSRLFSYKRASYILKITPLHDLIGNTDLIFLSGKFYISNIDVVVDNPTYLVVKVSLIEYLQTNVKRTSVNLVQGGFASDLKRLLRSFYGVYK